MAKTRYLSQGERRLCRHVFGDSVPRDYVEVIRRHGISGGFTPYGRINIDPSMYVEDFIGTGLSPNGIDRLEDPIEPVGRCHHFLHEMAHSWQHFVGMMIVDSYRRARKEARKTLRAQGQFRKNYSMKGRSFAKFEATYSYEITTETDLLDFTMEQQCEIIADFFGLSLWNHASAKSAMLGHAAPTLAQLRPILARFLADPGYPRDAANLNSARARYRAWAVTASH